MRTYVTKKKHKRNLAAYKVVLFFNREGRSFLNPKAGSLALVSIRVVDYKQQTGSGLTDVEQENVFRGIEGDVPDQKEVYTSRLQNGGESLREGIQGGQAAGNIKVEGRSGARAGDTLLDADAHHWSPASKSLSQERLLNTCSPSCRFKALGVGVHLGNRPVLGLLEQAE